MDIILRASDVPPDLMEYFEAVPDGKMPDVLTVSTEAYPGSHFATFPRKLVEPMILSGTSARGCCSRCRAPWERVVEREYQPAHAAKHGDHKGGAKGMPSENRWGDFPRLSTATTTTDWRPTCRCEGAEIIPCTVLDPFAGSGTTLYVARHHGRRAIGIELSPDYAKLCADRLKQGVLPLELL